MNLNLANMCKEHWSKFREWEELHRAEEVAFLPHARLIAFVLQLVNVPEHITYKIRIQSCELILRLDGVRTFSEVWEIGQALQEEYGMPTVVDDTTWGTRTLSWKVVVGDHVHSFKLVLHMNRWGAGCIAVETGKFTKPKDSEPIMKWVCEGDPEYPSQAEIPA